MDPYPEITRRLKEILKHELPTKADRRGNKIF